MGTPSRGFPKKRKIKDTEICIENDTSPKTKKRRLMNKNNASHRNLKNEKYDTTEIRIRMPNGRILQRSFAVNTKINELYTWCMIESNRKNVTLIRTMPSLNLQEYKHHTLKDLGLIRETLSCSYLDS